MCYQADINWPEKALIFMFFCVVQLIAGNSESKCSEKLLNTEIF